jgi:hypothetical protein
MTIPKFTQLSSLADVHRFPLGAILQRQAGTHPKVVAERLGHSSTMLTLDVYSHVAPICNQKPQLASRKCCTAESFSKSWHL